MIIDDKCFVWSYRKANSFDKESVGKWIYKGSLRRIKKLFGTIDELVESGVIVRAKYTTKDPLYDPFPDEKPHLFVYADDRTKDAAKKILTDLKFRPLKWKYDRETKEDWTPGGKLYNRRLMQLYGLGLDGPWE